MFVIRTNQNMAVGGPVSRVPISTVHTHYPSMSAPDKAAMPYELYSDTPKRAEEGDNAKKGEESDAGAMAAAFGVRAYVTLAVGAVGCYFAFIDPTYRPKVIEASFHQTNTNSDDLTTEFMYSSIFTLACIGLVGSCDTLVNRFNASSD